MNGKWEIRKIRDFVTIRNGYSFDSKLFSTETGMQLIRIRDLKNGINTQTKFDGQYDDQFLVNAGDLLVGMDGDFQCYQWQGPQSLLNQRVCKLVPDLTVVTTDFLKYGINRFLSEIQENTSFTTVKHLSSKQIEDIDFLLPPLEAQKEITAKLDSAFESFSSLTSSSDALRVNLNALWYAELENVFSSLSLEENIVCSLGDVANLVGGGTPSKSKEKYWNGSIPWATVRDLKGRYLEGTEHKITPIGLKESSSNLIESGNVVISTRVGLGKVIQLNVDAAINQDLRAVIPKDKEILDPNFIYFWYLSVAQKVVREGTGATVQGVKLPFISALKIPVPPISDQKLIVDRCETIFAEINFQIQEINFVESELNTFALKIVHEAYSLGES